MNGFLRFRSKASNNDFCNLLTELFMVFWHVSMRFFFSLVWSILYDVKKKTLRINPIESTEVDKTVCGPQTIDHLVMNSLFFSRSIRYESKEIVALDLHVCTWLWYQHCHLIYWNQHQTWQQNTDRSTRFSPAAFFLSGYRIGFNHEASLSMNSLTF